VAGLTMGQQVFVNCPEKWIWGEGKDGPSGAILPDHTNIKFNIWVSKW